MSQELLRSFRSLYPNDWKRKFIEFFATNKGDPSYGKYQKVHTDFVLCNDVVIELKNHVDFQSLSILVFNIEWIVVLIENFGVPARNITFVADSEKKVMLAQELYNITDCRYVTVIGKEVNIVPKIKKQFDVVIMNPPYNKPTTNGKIGSGNFLWPEFVEKALDLLKDDGWLAAIHPPKWRKPEDKLLPVMLSNNIVFLSMHTGADSLFGNQVATAADWYVLCKQPYAGQSRLICGGEEVDVNIDNLPFIPNGSFDVLSRILNNGQCCQILCGQMQTEVPAETYDTRKDTVQREKKGKFQHPLVNGTGKRGATYYYCSRPANRLWLVPKVIFGDANDTGNIVLDDEGVLGMTQHGIAIPISSARQGRQIIKALESEEWNRFLKSMTFGGFQIPYKMFKYFRHDFWKEFV